MINKWLVSVFVVAVLGLGASTYLLGKSLIETKTKLETTELALAELATKVSTVMNNQAEFVTTSNTITSSFRKQERELEALKNREETVLAKRSLVQLRINKAFEKDQLELACTTGDTTACE